MNCTSPLATSLKLRNSVQFEHPSQQLSHLNTGSVCIVNGLRHAVFTDIRAVFLADSIRLHLGTTFIRCIHTSTCPTCLSYILTPIFPLNIVHAALKPLKHNSDFSIIFCIISYRYQLYNQLAISKIVAQEEHNKINNSVKIF